MFTPKKSLGQYFLTNPHVPEWMNDAADLREGDTVVEIGPGTGVLTRSFLARGARVIALEADERALELLAEQFADEITAGTLTLHHTDIRDFDPCTLSLPADYKLVANIPYYLSGMIFRLFLTSDCPPASLTFLVQKEVAERIARDPKESLLSLSVKTYGIPRYVHTVSRGSFNPQPAVASAVVHVADIKKPDFAGFSEDFFFEILHLGFAAKRKQLLGNLTKRYDRALLEEIFHTLDLSLTVRAEDVPIATWVTLAAALAVHS